MTRRVVAVQGDSASPGMILGSPSVGDDSSLSFGASVKGSALVAAGPFLAFGQIRLGSSICGSLVEFDDDAGDDRFELSTGDAGASTRCVLDEGAVKGRGDGVRALTIKGVSQAALSGVYEPMRAMLLTPLAVDTA